MSFQMIVLMVPVFFGLIGFAVDLGRMYSARNDLKNAANSMAQAAASRLIGNEAAIENAQISANLAIDTSSGRGNLYDFGGGTIGQSNGNLNSEAPQYTYYDSASAAIGGENASGGEAGATTAKHVKVLVRGEAPLIFWRFLALAQEGRLNLAAQSIAGVSSPVCQACGIEPIALQAISLDDTVDFGFTVGTRYTFGYVCNGGPNPGAIANTAQRVPYVLLNKYNEGANVLADETTQAYRIGSTGLVAGTDPTYACIRINAEENIWTNATPNNCNQNTVNNITRTFLCGLAARFDSSTVPAACNAVPESDVVLGAAPQDADITDLDDFTAYTGNTRRIITVAIVETASTAAMPILAFRQFLLEPSAGDVTLNVNDANGRFAALYLGSVMPVRGGRIDGCAITSGPGKVVLHQ